MVGWAGYFASKILAFTPINPPITGFFPIFDEKAASFPVLKHVLKVLSAATEKLNPGQIPVVACDQPIYAICKMLSWQFDQYSEDKMVFLLGGLHTELCLWGIVGKLLDESEWI